MNVSRRTAIVHFIELKIPFHGAQLKGSEDSGMKFIFSYLCTPCSLTQFYVIDLKHQLLNVFQMFDLSYK